MEKGQYYLIEKGELVELLESHHKLCALEAGGVDSWNYYGLSIMDYDTEEPIDFYSLASETLSDYQKLDGTKTSIKRTMKPVKTKNKWEVFAEGE